MEIDVRSTANLRPIIEMDIGETTKKTLATLKAEKHKERHSDECAVFLHDLSAIQSAAVKYISARS